MPIRKTKQTTNKVPVDPADWEKFRFAKRYLQQLSNFPPTLMLAAAADDRHSGRTTWVISTAELTEFANLMLHKFNQWDRELNND